jgi:YidC/Oxa1 family membrane protein insertase
MYQEFIFKPLYNGLVSIMNIPGVDVGIAVILFTIIVRFILYPLSKSSLLAQVRMKEVEPEINKIRTQYASDKQTQAMKTMELYREKKIKPFSGVLLLIIQLPILFALISVFYKIIPSAQPELLYSFVNLPDPSTTFLGIDMTTKSLTLAILTAIAQFLQLHYSVASIQQKKIPKNPNAVPNTADMMSSMTTNMKYIMPLFVFISLFWLIPASFPAAASVIALYWFVSTAFTLFQELYIRKRVLKM